MSKIKPFTYFTFLFSLPNPANPNDNFEHLHGFKVYLKDSEDLIDDMVEFLDSVVEESKPLLELDFGVHDVSTLFPVILSYTSYEVPSDRVLELMNRWKDLFHQEGFETGELFFLSDIVYNDTREQDLYRQITPEARSIVRKIEDSL